MSISFYSLCVTLILLLHTPFGLCSAAHQQAEISLTGAQSTLSHNNVVFPSTNISRLTDAFISYCKIPTQADPFSDSLPSSARQLVLAQKLKDQLAEILGKDHVRMDENGFVYGFLKAHVNQELRANAGDVPTIALLAHMDTTYQHTDENCEPQIHKAYKYPDALKNSQSNVIVASLDERYDGHTIISSNGDTILGADDKAGVAIIMEVARLLQENKEHLYFPNMVFGFTVDEEIGKGAHHYDVTTADFAYTIDGGERGEYSLETFSADSMIVTIFGQGIHPSIAKGKLVNALRLASKFVAKVNDKITPEHTEDRQGFVHLVHMEGNGEKATLHFLIRSFDDDELLTFENHLQSLLDETLQETPIPGGSYELQINQSYRNMRPILKNYPDMEDYLFKAMKQVNIEPKVRAIRGGTDGSTLSFRDLPTINVFSGMQNIHSLGEFVSVDDMDASVQTLMRMLNLWAEQGKKRDNRHDDK